MTDGLLLPPEHPRSLVYFGSPEAAVPPLLALVEAGFEIPLVVSMPDRRRGRRTAPEATAVKAAATQLQIVGELKIAASIGKSPGKAKPKRAPFWRSDLTITTLAVNISAVERLLNSGISELVVNKDGNADKSFKFELSQVKAGLKMINSHWINAATSDQQREVLFRSHESLAKTVQILQKSYPRALGLIFGFNTLDGD